MPFGKKRLRAKSHLVTKLQSLKSRAPQTGEALVAYLGAAVFEALIKYFFLLPTQAFDALSGGICLPAMQAAGQAITAYDLDTLVEHDAVLLHTPISTTINNNISVANGGRWVRAQLRQMLHHPLGDSALPGDLLDLDFADYLASQQLRLYDLGDVSFQPTTDNASHIGERTTYLCQRIVAQGAYPLLLGGDHALAFYSIAALQERYSRLGVIQFDAHTDLYTLGAACDEQLNHANVMNWVRKMQHVQSIWQIGIRDLYYQPTENLQAIQDPKIQTLSAFEAETTGYHRLWSNMDPNLPWFISFDVDVLAGVDCPETATPVLGGLSYYSLLACFEQLYANYNVVGLEFVEIGDSSPGAHGAAAIAARLISRFLFHRRGAKVARNTLYIKPAEANQ
ncbi:arginase family protein [Neisseriaceae bacterium TC5R-5]|nr:arginase family protein [Neisseriaceae bacterium TC5R-5]